MNTKSTSYFKDVLSSVERTIGKLGFVQRRRGIFLLPLSDDCVAFLGLNKADIGSQEIEVNPVIGIRHTPIERLVAEVSDMRFDPVVPPTLAGNIGYMTPNDKYLSFVFRGQRELDLVAAELSETITRYGLPFINNLTSLRNLVAAMTTVRFRNTIIVDYRIPAGYYLLNEVDNAVSFLNERLKLLEGRSDAAAQQYIRFAGRLLSRCGRDTCQGKQPLAESSI